MGYIYENEHKYIEDFKNLNRLIATTIRLHIIKFSKNYYERKNSLKTKQNIQVARYGFSILHRKEVIHPHVLVGIPCYDFTPITCPTLNGPLHKWLGYHIRVLQTFVA